MPIKRPDLYEHNNSNNAIVDSDGVRGGRRTVTDLTALYSLSNKLDQLKEQITIVYVISEAKDYKLVDINNVNNSTGWVIYNSGTGSTSFISIELESSDEEVILLWDTNLQEIHGTRPVLIELFEVTSSGSVKCTSPVYTEDDGDSYKWYVGNSSPRVWEIRITGYTQASQPIPPTPSTPNPPTNGIVDNDTHTFTFTGGII